MRAGVPVLEGLPLLNRGKVRDTYDLGNGLLLIVATDGISIFDFVLNALVPEKGAILTAMTHFWFTLLEKELGIKTHMVAAGAAIDDYLPNHLRNYADLQSRAMVVQHLNMTPAELIERNCLTGSGLKEYQSTGKLAGITLPPGLQDGDLLPEIIFDPTDKAENGHDERIDPDAVRAKFPEEVALSRKVFAFAIEFAKQHGIMLADTKFEIGRDAEGNVVLADEALTPDSSRFWEELTWWTGRELEKRKAPSPFDKQFIRIFGIEAGINKFDPKNQDDVERVHALIIPQELIDVTTRIYRYIFWRLTGMRLERYQREAMGIDVADRKRKIAIVFGSMSDIDKLRPELEVILSYQESSVVSGITFNVVSCHRNPEELRTFAATGCGRADVVIAADGMAFALPGVLDAWLHSMLWDVPVIGVALGEANSKALEAARLSISELPGQPVVIDEKRGEVYEGPSGFMDAMVRAMHGELPVKVRAGKPAQFNIEINPQSSA